MESWVLFSRIERELPTHDSNTTAYAEISMSVTKETQFVRMKSRSLPELLSVICDGSEVNKNKLIEIGNIRTLVLEKAKSKYNVAPFLKFLYGGLRPFPPASNDTHQNLSHQIGLQMQLRLTEKLQCFYLYIHIQEFVLKL